MADHPTEVDADRGPAMLVLYAQGCSFPDMIKPMIACGLLRCQTTHRFRQTNAGSVCATCENTLYVSWRRHMKDLGATDSELATVKGEWFTAHETVQRICAQRFVQEDVTETTRTEIVEGKPVSVTTTRKQIVINVALLRLWVDVADKIARMRGLNVKNPASARKIQRRLMRVYERDADGLGDQPAN